ncbi:hypothetical protein [Brevundimonas sp. A19_0]|uniref:hypothetical protein n=1 Tax=Brevundimonas sp. A19_0 TaxID=2821087 RepID=UPI001ADB2E0E|nr:hypothetical protein [Brevundimonas sp. A19_0]MBO9501396.1 hypothetical protein [Brevundimonas sp. A19_0]
MALEDARPQGPISLFLGFWRDETVVIRSPMRPIEALAALSEQVDPMFTLFGKRPARGHVGTRGGWLRKRIHYRNSLQTVVRFDVTGDGVGSRLTCWVGAAWFSRIFIILWAGGVAMIGSGVMAAEFREGRFSLALVPMFMLTLAVLLIVVCRWFARHEGSFLTDLIVEAVDGRVVR